MHGWAGSQVCRAVKTFEMIRDVDHSGISGTGKVAEGVVFSDETCCMRWLTNYSSTAFYLSLDDLIAIHGHNGDTRLVFHNGA
jgi:hypothetical protein